MTKAEYEQLNTLLGKMAQEAQSDDILKIIKVLKLIPKLVSK